jgi:integrase
MQLAQPRSLRAGARHRALILVGWAGALRRSELVALNTSDITVSDLGAEL